MPDVWTNPIDRVLRELISPAIWNADLAANLRVLSTHRHTGAAGDGAIISATETQSGPLAHWVTGMAVPSANAQMAGAANQVRFMRFFLPFNLSLSALTFNVQALSGGSTGGIGIYNKDGTSLLASGTASTASTGVKRVSVTPVVLPIGFYLLAWTNTGNVATFFVGTVNANLNAILNDTTPHTGTAANASAVGVLPATTGVLSAAALDVPVVKLEGS